MVLYRKIVFARISVVNLLSCFLAILCLSCNDTVTVDDPSQRKGNLIKIPQEFQKGMYGYFTTGVWLDSTIYYTRPLRSITIGSSFEVQESSTLSLYKRALFLEADKMGRRLLYVSSLYTDISEGSLWEFDVSAASHKELLDSTFHVVSAVFTRNNDIIYYSRGSAGGIKAGYYLIDRITGARTLLFAYESELGAREIVNGFDLHPDNNSLLIPVTRLDRSPLIVRYRLDTHLLDTLYVDFDRSYNRVCLWLRYNRDASKILYSQYPIHSFNDAPSDNSELGVIDVATGEKTIIPVNPQYPAAAINVFPNWSPDERHIVFGSAPVLLENGGVVGTYELVIMRDFLTP